MPVREQFAMLLTPLTGQAYHSIFLQDPDIPTIGPSAPPLAVGRPLHSVPAFDGRTLTTAGNFPILPLRTRTRGPAFTLPQLPADVDPTAVPADSESYDCLDEVLSLFRANTLFRNFEIKGAADRMLIYGILFISECLGKVRPTIGARDADKVLTNVALDPFALPGEAGFPLNQAFEGPRDRQDAEALRQYISQVRQELAMRLHTRLYPGGVGPSKVCLLLAGWINSANCHATSGG